MFLNIKNKNKFLLLSLPLIFLFEFTSFTQAQTIQTGNASAKASVSNTVEGGSIKTHIEVEANGEKKVLDTNQPGTNSLYIENSGQASGTSSISPSVSRSVLKPKVENKTSKTDKIQKNIFEMVSEKIKQLLQKIYSLLK